MRSQTYGGLNRGEMFAQWGSSSEEWEGVYPNPRSIEAQKRVEMALIRRAGSKAHNSNVWGAFEFRVLSEGKDRIVTGSQLSPSAIMKFHKDAAERSGKAKFGASRREVLDTSRISSLLVDVASDELEKGLNDVQALNVAKEAYQQFSTKNLGLLSKEIDMLYSEKDIEKRIQVASEVSKKIETLGPLLQKIIQEAGSIDKRVGEARVDDLVVPGLGEALRIEPKAYTAAINILEYLKVFDKIKEGVEKDVEKLPSIGYKKGTKTRPATIEIGKYSSNKGVYKYNKTIRSITDGGISKGITGSMNNLLGSMFEVAFASALKNSLGGIIEDVELLGSSGEAVSKVKGFDGEFMAMKESKRDLSATMKRAGDAASVSLGFSAKSQKKGRTTKLLDTSTDQVLNTVSTTPFHKNMLEIAFGNENMWQRKSSMNSLLAAMMTDMAVAGLEGDRVDFIVYQDTVIPIEEFYAYTMTSPSKAVHFKAGSAKAGGAQVVENGSTGLVFFGG